MTTTATCSSGHSAALQHFQPTLYLPTQTPIQPTWHQQRGLSPHHRSVSKHLCLSCNLSPAYFQYSLMPMCSNLGRHQGGMAARPFVLAHVMKCWTREATIDMCRGQNNAAARRPKKVSAGRQPAATAAVILQRAALAAAPLRTWPLWSPLSFCLTLSLGVIRFCYASVCL